jgi:4-hydroxybenzoate polyprenyltransferase
MSETGTLAPARHPRAGESLPKRLWIYQSTRFPLFKTAGLLAVFSAASISVSAHLAHRPLPSPGVFVIAWLVALIIFFQMRAADEYKDLEDDSKYRPERPIPSGLVSLRLILGLALAGIPAALSLTALLDARLWLLLALVWGWLGLMTVEFFAHGWLRRHPLAYLLTHMAIMPLIDLFITGCEWLPHGGHPPAALSLFLGLSFVNGSVIELGRKIWAPENERPGVETYSRLLGPARAAHALMAVSAVSWGLLVAVGYAVGAMWIVAAGGLIVLGLFWRTLMAFARHPDPAGQKRIDTMAGLWVFACYALGGYAPFLAGAAS